jgi:hypothetical protein
MGGDPTFINAAVAPIPAYRGSRWNREVRLDRPSLPREGWSDQLETKTQ